MFACCANKEDLAKEKAADKEEDGVQACADTPVKAQPAVTEKSHADAAAGPGTMDNPKAAEKHAVDSEKAAAKAKAQQFASFMKDGEAAFGKSDWDSAITAYSKAIELDGSSGSALAGRGGARLRKGDVENSLGDLNEALRLEKENLFALRDRAEARLKSGDLDGAAEDFNTKLSLAPGDGRALCGRGEVRLKKGDKEGALSDFQLAMRLNYPGAEQLFKNAKAGK